MRREAVAAAAVLVAAGCRYHPTPVPLAGERSSITALAGTWTGAYRGTESGRTGSITFTIQVTGDSAFGDVLMHDPSSSHVVRPADDPIAHRLHARGPHLLAVRFLEIAGGEVEGTLEPYVAPDCDCTVRTAFMGQARGDTIRGMFATRAPRITPQTGTWVVTRIRSGAIPVSR